MDKYDDEKSVISQYLSPYLDTVVGGCEKSTHRYGSGESNTDWVSMCVYDCVSLHVVVQTYVGMCILVSTRERRCNSRCEAGC